ncbi:MAG: M3 family oligoendopeptidase [Clostridia bacterium]
MNWDLTKLYACPDDPKLLGDMARLAELTARTRALLEGAVSQPAARVLAEVLTREGELTALFNKLSNFLMLTLAADAENEQAQARYDALMTQSVDLEQLDSALSRYVGSLSDLDAVIEEAPLLTEHAYLLHEYQRQAAHTIDPALEAVVLTMQLTGGHAWEKLRDLLDATHTVPIGQGAGARTVTLSEARALAYDPDPTVRKAAYEGEIAAYKAIEAPMAAALSGIKGEALTLVKLRNYDSVLDQSLDQSKIDRAALDAMLTAIKEYLPVFRRYLRLKAKALGHEGGLPFYDLFAPIGEAGARYTLEDARALLVRELGAFRPKMGEMIERAFDENWIDAYPRPGKQGGAFCSGAYPIGISYVLSNFDGSLNAVSTLAHELGHAYHDQQLFKNSILNADAPMTLAETASIFNETLLTQALIARADKQEKVMLLDQELTEATQTVVDIYSRYLFEAEVIAVRKDRTLPARELCELMRDAQRKSYGDGLSPDALHPYMWACKSHYYSSELHFYNFPYAFGLLFGKGVYALKEEKGAAFGAIYDHLLREAGLGDARTVAAHVGIDLTAPDFWRASLSVIARAIDQLAELIG